MQSFSLKIVNQNDWISSMTFTNSLVKNSVSGIRYKIWRILFDGEITIKKNFQQKILGKIHLWKSQFERNHMNFFFFDFPKLRYLYSSYCTSTVNCEEGHSSIDNKISCLWSWIPDAKNRTKNVLLKIREREIICFISQRVSPGENLKL